jgi:hypothetical protein
MALSEVGAVEYAMRAEAGLILAKASHSLEGG